MQFHVIVRAPLARALILALSFACLPLTAAATSTDARALKLQLSRSAALPPAAPIKEEDLSRRARLSQVKLSPDGRSIAFFETDGQGLALNVIDAATGARKKLLALNGRPELHWTGDSSAIFIDSGDALAAVTIADGTSTKVASFDPKAEQQFVAVDPSHPRHALTEAFDRAAQRYRISRVGVDGSSTVIHEGDKQASQFLVDGAGQVSFIRTLDQDFSQVVARKQDGKWVEVRRCKRLQPCDLVAASTDGRYLTMAVNYAQDRKTLVRIDLSTGAASVVHSDPQGISDLRQALLSPATQQPQFAIYDLPVRRNYGLDETAKRAAADIDKRFPDANISIGASAGPRWLLTERSARLMHERYWIYELASRKIAPVLEQERSLGLPLAEDQLARKIPLHYLGSDGAPLHGYLSLPPGRQAATLAMITMVHAGPWAKVGNDYTPLVQLLVNRGYAVFQPNFRASIGYGDKYMVAPRSDFGNGRVQADIIDGVHYLLANGVGDKNRLGIMGESFGGYATLLALTHTPDLFKLGIAVVPPPDFARAMKAAASRPGQGGEAPFSVTLEEMGIDMKDEAAMQKITDDAPAAHPDKISKPLLILAGGKDQMVDPASITDYVARLQGMGKAVTLLIDPDEGHNLRKPLVRQAYSYLVQRMLQEHLGGAAVAPAGPQLESYLKKTINADGALKQANSSH